MQKNNRQDQNASQTATEWQNVCDLFKAHCGEMVFKAWLEKCKCEVISGDTAFINAPTRFIKDRIDSEYKGVLLKLWQRVNQEISIIDIMVGSRQNTPATPHTAQIIQLPLWAEPARGTPNGVLRGALFAAINPNKRRALRRETIADEKNLKIIFTGWQLDQSDRDVWELALHMARQQPLGQGIYFTAHGFLKALGRATGKAQHEWLKDVFARLGGCFAEITHNNYTYADNLLGFEREEETQRYKLTVNPKMANLYMAGWTQTDYEERTHIGNKKFLALWLHGYIASHAQLYPTKVETFYRLSGSTNTDIYSFKRQLLKALEDLKSIDLIKDYAVERQLVHIEKYPSGSQIRHLNKHT